MRFTSICVHTVLGRVLHFNLINLVFPHQLLHTCLEGVQLCDFGFARAMSCNTMVLRSIKGKFQCIERSHLVQVSQCPRISSLVVYVVPFFNQAKVALTILLVFDFLADNGGHVGNQGHLYIWLQS